MSKAFLSHSSVNKPLVARIAQQLGKNNCHYDELTFEAGMQTLQEIFKSLEDTDIFVLFISEPALQSEWVQNEISQAKQLLDTKIIERIFPLIIESAITYNDPRIPDWIKKPYNIKYFDNEVIILKKIKQFLRESNFKKYTYLKDLNELFVGRHQLQEEFERRIFNINNIKPSCLIAHNFFEGMGRRTFLKNSLTRTRITNKWYEPIYIPFSPRESIEDFIYKLNFVNPAKTIFNYNFSEEELESKIQIAKGLLKTFADSNELIFLIDDGGIVLPNKEIVNWFSQLISSEEFYNQITICIISKFKPNPILLRKTPQVISFQVDELQPTEIQTLFIRYLDHFGVHITTEDSLFFLKHFNGIPGQVVYAANLITSVGIQEAKGYISNIEEFDQASVTSILEYLQKDQLCIQMLIALARFEIISHDIIYKIFGENKEVYASIQKLYDLGLFYNVSTTHQYLKLNSSVIDYFTRARLDLEAPYNQNLRVLVRESITKPLKLDEDSDYSEFLFQIENLLRAGKKIPSKYFIPSFILKAIVQEYYGRNFEVAIDLAQRLIASKNKFDAQIIREIRYWLCLSYCKTSNKQENSDNFFEEVQYFRDDVLYNLKDYYFLLGFFHRNADNMDKAEEYFLSVLDIDEEHSKTNRELVNVYLRKRQYDKALTLAEKNYDRFKSNIHHINAYFTCLIKKTHLTEKDKSSLNELLEKTKKSLDKRSTEFYRTMLSEFEYYVKHNVRKAIENLLEDLRLNKKSYHSYKALSEIFRREEMLHELEELNKVFPNLAKQDY